jgi:class 3 adenylate cyclase
VNIASRVGALAGPSQVLVSQTVKDLVAGSGLTFEDCGEYELKGVSDRWRLYRVVSESPEWQAPPLHSNVAHKWGSKSGATIPRSRAGRSPPPSN